MQSKHTQTRKSLQTQPTKLSEQNICPCLQILAAAYQSSGFPKEGWPSSCMVLTEYGEEIPELIFGFTWEQLSNIMGVLLD